MSVPWVPIREFIPGLTFLPDPEPAWTGMVDGYEAWTDDHVLLVGKPPKLTFGIVGQKDFGTVVSRAMRPGLQRITPLAVADLSRPTVVFSNGVLVDFRFYMLVRKTFPKCQWWADEQSRHDPRSPVVLKQDGEVFLGLVSGLRADDYTEDIGEILRAVSAEQSTGTKSTGG